VSSIVRVLRRVTGMRGTGSLALALLAGGCVLAATAGPRQAQATDTRALQQTMNAVPSADKAIVVGSSWARINATANLTLTTNDVVNVTSQLRRDYGSGPLSLAKRPADWLGMNAGEYSVLTAPPRLNGLPGKLEVDYRYPVAGHLRLVAGRMPANASLPVSTKTQYTFVFQVVVTPQTAARFGLRVGSQVPIAPPLEQTLPGNMTPQQQLAVRLDVTGIVAPTDPGSSFWTTDPLMPAPNLVRVGAVAVWEGAVIADPGEIVNVQQLFGQSGLLLAWELPIDTTRLHGPALALYDQANQITNQTPALTSPYAPMANSLNVSVGLVQPLAAFIQASDDVNVLLWIVYASLAMASIVTLLLAARMMVVRRSAELALCRARGASVWQVFWRGTRGAAVACVPAAALAWVLAVLLVPGAAPPGSVAWWPGIATIVLAAIGPGAVAAWQYRLPRSAGARQRRHRRRRLPRVVFEVTACAAAIGGITVFRMQTSAGDVYASVAPVLVAVPAVIVALRLYQLVLRGLARASAQRRGVIGFVGLTRAAHAPVTLVLPAMTLVLALTVAAFTGMVRTAVVRGEIVASWQAAGADAVVSASSQLGISPSAVHVITAVPGVQHAASVRLIPLTIGADADLVTAVIVDPASYAALTASTEGFAPVRPALLTQARGQGAIPVLASAQAAVYLGGRSATIATQAGLPALSVRVTGELRSTPALPAGGAFIVLPVSAIQAVSAPPPVNLILLTGPAIDMTRLQAAVRAAAQGLSPPAVSTRSLVLGELTGAPLQQGTFLLFTLAIAFAAALALAVMLFELALGAADREKTTARLATMGLTESQRARLVALEVVPSIAASAVAAAACAIALPRLVAPAIDLSVFTGSTAPVPLGADVGSFLLPLAVLLGITIIALAYEIRSRRGGAAAAIRI
jgi:putative ABC transport system permease protein